MDRFEPNLRIPGPTALPPSVRTAGARQTINHCGPEFAAMSTHPGGMKPFFGTTSTWRCSRRPAPRVRSQRP